MSDIKMASRAHAVKHFAPGEVYVRTLQEAFEAGAAWQREQDAKICHKKVMGGTDHSACHEIADAILSQAEPVRTECLGCAVGGECKDRDCLSNVYAKQDTCPECKGVSPLERS